jgi:phospholipid/cholesterol/gamma-HCH transport system substrate-binding protein
METKANYVMIGAFVVIFVAGMVGAVLWLAGAQYSEEFAYYKTLFTGAVTGLGKGTPVRYNGIAVGHVSQLTFDSEDPKKVIVLLQVNPALPIHADSVASIASQGLTGESYVEIDGGSKAAPVLVPTLSGEPPTIRSKPSTLEELEESAPQVLAKISGLADRLSDVVNDKNRAALADTLANLKTTTGVLAQHSAEFGKTLNNLAVASQTLNGDLVVVHDVLGHADVTTQKLNKLADDADSTITGARLDALTGQTRVLVASLSRLSDQLQDEPTRLIFGDRRKGYSPQ